MKKFNWWIFVAVGAVYLLGIFTGSMLFKPKPTVTTTTTTTKPETTWVTIIDTLRLVSKDTVIIIAGNVVKTKKITITDSLYFGVNGIRYYTPFKVGLLTDTLYGYAITYKPGEVTTVTQKGYTPPLFYGGLAVSVDNKKILLSELELGMRLGRIGLFGRAEATNVGNDLETVARVGFRVNF